MATSDIDKHTACATKRNLVQKRVGNCLLGRLDGAIFASSFTGSHHRLAHFVHHRANVGEVEVDQAWPNHEIGNTFDALIKHVIGHRERLSEGRFLGGKAEQVLVGNDDQRVNDLLQGFDTLFGLTHPLGTFELERLGHHTHGQYTQLTRGLRDDRRSARAGATAHSGGNETHMRPGKLIYNLFDAFLGRSGTNRCPRPGTKTFGHFYTKLNTTFRPALLKGLCVGIGHNEIDALKRLVDHVVHRIAAGTANAENRDTRLEVTLLGHSQIQSHDFPPVLWSAFAAVYCLLTTIITQGDRNRHEKKRVRPQNLAIFLL